VPSHLRLAVALCTLAVVWALSFAVESVPFFPTVLIGSGLAALFAVWLGRGDGIRVRLTASGVVIGAVVGVAHLFVGRGLYAWASTALPALTRDAAPIYERMSQVPVLWRVVLAGAIAAPLEELFWRGTAHPRIVPKGSALKRTLIGALVYAGFHVVTLNPALVAAAGLGGLVWAGLTEWRDDLTPALVAHGIWTGAMVLYPPTV